MAEREPHISALHDGKYDAAVSKRAFSACSFRPKSSDDGNAILRNRRHGASAPLKEIGSW